MSPPRPWDEAWAPLVAAAREALPRARGRPRRGAAVAGAVGIVHAGASISVEQTPAASLCAEQIALADFCAAGEKAIARLVVIGPPPRGAPAPCGRCLQVLREFGEGVEIRWGTATREYGRSSLTRLLPHAFGDYRTARARRRG